MEITSTKQKTYNVIITLTKSEVEILSKAYDIIYNIEEEFTKYEDKVCKFPDITLEDLVDVNYFLSILIPDGKISITVIDSD